ncbi:MAG TPA: porin family protein [Gemmatimonadaceae bacterium]|nr:porin family protein [Gemmatimonadaceae bacterium]
MTNMKVGLVALGLSLLVAPAAQAQFGIKAGASFGSISNQGVLPGDLSDRTGFTGGLTANASFGIFGVGVDALYAQRGAKSDAPDALAATRLDYVDVPIYLTAGVPVGVVRPYVYAGPQMSFEVSCRTSNGFDCPDTDRPKTDYAAVVGAGVRLGGALGLEGRYVYGLRDLKLSTVSSGTSYKNRSFMILVSLTH